MSLHFPLPKFRTFRFSLHTSRLSLRGEVTMVALKFAMSSHFPLPKNFSPSGVVPPLSNGTSRATSDRNPRQMIKSCPVLYCAWGTFGERERERERYRQRDGSDVTIVALKLAMNLHFPLPKIRTIGDELTLSLAKISHFSFLPSHFPSLPSRRGHHGGAEIRNEFTLSIAKKFFALRLCSPSFKWHEPRDEWSKTQDKWSNPAQSNFSSHWKNESN